MEKNEPPRRRSSFFGYNVPAANIESNYVDQLSKEDKEWKEHLIETNKKFKIYWRNVKEGNETDDGRLVMSKERNEFLDKRIDMPAFVQHSEELSKEIDFYIRRKQWFLEKYEMLIEDLQGMEIDGRIRQTRLLKAKQESVHSSPPLPSVADRCHRGEELGGV